MGERAKARRGALIMSAWEREGGANEEDKEPSSMI